MPTRLRISAPPNDGVQAEIHLRKGRLQEMHGKAKRVRALRSGRASRITITRVGLHTSTMYACEVDPLTLSDLQPFGIGVAVGMHLERGPK